MARYVFVMKDKRGNVVLYNESSHVEDKMDREGEGGGYLAFWRRCMEDVFFLTNGGKDEWHGEIEDLSLGEIVKSW